MSDQDQRNGLELKKEEEEKSIDDSSEAASAEDGSASSAQSGNLYWEQVAAICIDREYTNFTEIKRGVRQGCVLSPDLFNLNREVILHNVTDMEAAGIPDFRSPGSGLYDNLAAYDLPSPQAIFDIEFFKENPKPFFVLAKELYPGSFKPTLCHYFIKMLADKGKLLRHYTQNIDTLERVAGLDPEKLIEAHGTFHTSHCVECQKEFPLDWMKEQIFADTIPKCTLEDCEGVVKPDIVFFGESLPQRFATAVGQDFKKCDLLIVTGTSLMVQPFASLTNRVPAETPRLYINLEKGASNAHPITVLFFGGGGFNFDGEDNYRDVFKGATCDEGCQELADLLGWGDELKEIIKREHARIDRETSGSSTSSPSISGNASVGPAAKSSAASPTATAKPSASGASAALTKPVGKPSVPSTVATSPAKASGASKPRPSPTGTKAKTSTSSSRTTKASTNKPSL
ncbi:NAD-dependent protein deacetylase sirtuin-2 [Elysia marginata]|uniref:NAD-dependent protein deacetylase sirtuin-2 n=1 Tax=Elysia marginata TaxID=1093978 RepID=A0AAV4FCH3_9GAST|nr:NAD-dependent protein deacetylase sirtuin-2 [Elysia marginata]